MGPVRPHWQRVPLSHWKAHGYRVLERMAESDPSPRVRKYTTILLPLYPLADIRTAPGWVVFERRADEFDELLMRVPYPEIVEKLAPEWGQPFGDLLDVAEMLGGNPEATEPRLQPGDRQHQRRRVS